MAKEKYEANGRYLVEIKFSQETVRVELAYDSGLLYQAHVKTHLPEEQIVWLWNWMPVSINNLIARGKHPKVMITQIHLDLSFERFWEEYAYKVGKKDRARRIWEALPEGDRAKALESIPKYNYYLAERPHIQRLYPETFLSQRRFENEYK